MSKFSQLIGAIARKEPIYRGSKDCVIPCVNVKPKVVSFKVFNIGLRAEMVVIVHIQHAEPHSYLWHGRIDVDTLQSFYGEVYSRATVPQY